jgi:hypothetical protein
MSPIRQNAASDRALLCQHLATPLKDAVEGDEGGLGGHYPPWVILGGGWINLSVTGNGEPCQR